MADCDAIIFDFDGVLARTMEDNFKAWKAALSDYGLALKEEDYYPLEGLSVGELPAALFAKFGVEPPHAEEVARRKEDYYLAHHRFAFYPGARELVSRLHSSRIPIAVVTSARARRLARSVPRGFLEAFDAVITGDDTERGKPSPQPYLAAAKKLGVEPGRCLVIENAPLGIESAKAAGAYCIALCTTLERRHLEAADEIVDSLADVARSQKVRGLLARRAAAS